jgi:hypothetical protein
MATKLNLKNLALNEDALSKRLVWVDFKGVKFQIRYLSRATLAALAEQFRVAAFDQRTGQRNITLDADKFIPALAETMVKNWDGATPEVLSLLYPLNLESLSPEDRKTPMEFNQENLLEVMKNANGLDEFLQTCATDAGLFRSPAAESLEKNSSPSQNTI